MDILIGDSAGLYEYGLEKGNRKSLLNFLDYRVDVGEIMSLSLTSGEDIVCVLGGIGMVEGIAVFRPHMSSTPQPSSAFQTTQESEDSGSEPEDSAMEPDEVIVPKEKETITLAIMEMRNYVNE